MDIGINLNDITDASLQSIQKEHLNSIRWLIGSGRGSGRSFLLAWVFIEYAISNCGVWVRVWDHHDSHRSRHWVLQSVRYILRNSRLRNQVSYKEDSFMIKAPLIEAWLE